MVLMAEHEHDDDFSIGAKAHCTRCNRWRSIHREAMCRLCYKQVEIQRAREKVANVMRKRNCLSCGTPFLYPMFSRQEANGLQPTQKRYCDECIDKNRAKGGVNATRIRKARYAARPPKEPIYLPCTYEGCSEPVRQHERYTGKNSVRRYLYCEKHRRLIQRSNLRVGGMTHKKNR